MLCSEVKKGCMYLVVISIKMKIRVLDVQRYAVK